MSVRIDVTGMRAPELYPEVGPRDAPPADAAAECALLAMCEFYPALVGSLHGLGELLVFPEHRSIWRAMSRVYIRAPSGAPDVVDFWLGVQDELCTELCGDGQAHEHDRENCTGWRTLRVLDFGEHANPKDIPYWMARLERVHEARRLIDLAQQVAERAWRMDLVGARVATNRMQPRSVVRVEIE
jgi:hypothetical protein